MEKKCEKCGSMLIRKETEYPGKFSERRFCSRMCAVMVTSKTRKKVIPWNKGLTYEMSDEAKKNIAIANRIKIAKETPEQRQKRTTRFRTDSRKGRNLGKTGEKSPNWTGDRANYNSKHKWVQKRWTKTGTCEHCGDMPNVNPLKRLKNATYWHNPTKTYLRERSEWMEVCAKCHYKLDHQ